jgi:hypothetical protein
MIWRLAAWYRRSSCEFEIMRIYTVMTSLLTPDGQPPSACADCKNGRAATIADPISPGTAMAINANLIYFSINFLY